jgi:hypothetical protein
MNSSKNMAEIEDEVHAIYLFFKFFYLNYFPKNGRRVKGEIKCTKQRGSMKQKTTTHKHSRLIPTLTFFSATGTK